MVTEAVPKKVVNQAQLDLEISASAGEAYLGSSYNRLVSPNDYLLHFADGTPKAVIDAAKLVYANHDPNVLTPFQMAEGRQLQAAADLALEDFAQVKDAINGLSVADPIKAVLRRMNRNTARLALAIKASTGTDPGA